MPPNPDRLILNIGQFFVGVAEGQYAISAMTFAFALAIIVVAVVYRQRA